MRPFGDYQPLRAGVGGNPIQRPDQRQLARSRAGSGPAPQNNVFIGRLVVVFGTGSTGGIFFYTGSPGLGNPPALAITNASSDPYGNPVTAAAITDSGFPFLIYSGPPALGNLIVSLAPAAGVDDVGNSYPEGLNVTAGTISGVSISGTTITLDPGPYLLYGNPGQVVQYLTGSGNWLAPAGVTSVYAECWGASAGTAGAPGGGGGGGEYAAEPALAVTPGNNYAYVQGLGSAGAAGGNTAMHGDTVTVTAHGGSLNTGFGGGAGGAGSTNTTHYKGGAGGGASVGTGGGGGGSSAGTSSAGNNGHGASGATGGAGGAAPTGGGAGGKGGNTGANGSAGSAPGGGAGGEGNGAGGTPAGEAGQIRLTYTASGSVVLLASLASSAGTDPNTGDAYPGPGLGLAAQGTPAAVSGFAAVFANANDDLGFVGGLDGQDYDTGRVVRYTAGQTVSSTTPAPVNWGSGSNPLIAAGTYKVTGHFLCTMGATTAAALFQLTTTGTVSAMRCMYYAIENVSILASNSNTSMASMSSGSIPNGTAGQFFFEAIITFSAAGNLGLEVAEGTTGDSWTLNSQSQMTVEPVVA
jgi:hypothetical protein